MRQLNIAQLPLGTSMEFLLWVTQNQIGNWEKLLEFIANDSDWHKQQVIPFECSEEESTMVLLR